MYIYCAARIKKNSSTESHRLRSVSILSNLYSPMRQIHMKISGQFPKSILVGTHAECGVSENVSYCDVEFFFNPSRDWTRCHISTLNSSDLQP